MTKYKHSLQDDIGYWLSRLRMKVHSSFLAKLAKQDITIPEWRILISLYNNDASNIVELADFIEVDKGAVSRVLDKLEASGLVTRQSGKDRRSSIVCLTKKGEELTPKLAQLAELNEKEFFSCLSDNEKKQLKSILKKLLQHAGIESLGGWLSK
jgi:MarR family transcriptional regulator, organic hydroperoxide resistance regulator